MIYQKFSSHPKIRNYCLRWKKKLTSVSNKVVNDLKEDIEGILIIPKDLDFETNLQKHHISKLVKVIFITKNILAADEIENKIKKRESVISKIFKEEDVELEYLIIHLEELWNRFNDYSKLWSYSLSRGYILYSNKVIDSLVLSIKLKEKILEKFERYVLAICFSGSVARLTYNENSDFDLFIVIDDTDVKKMTKDELRNKIIAIFQGNINELSRVLKTSSNLNFQTYLLTDFWFNLKNNSPVVHTLLRDGKPLFDKGIFVAWKKMLQNGVLTPTSTACELYKQDSERKFSNISKKIDALIFEDLYWVLIQYAQAILMINSIPPTTPQETILTLSNDIKKFDLNKSAIQYIDELYQTRKKYEHGEIKEFTISDLNNHFNKTKKTKNELEISYKKQKVKSIKTKLSSKIDFVNDTLKSITIEFEKILELDDHEFKRNFETLLYSHQLGENSIEMIINQIQNELKDDKVLSLDYYERALFYLDNKINQIKELFFELMSDKNLHLKIIKEDYILTFPKRGISFNVKAGVIN